MASEIACHQTAWPLLSHRLAAGRSPSGRRRRLPRDKPPMHAARLPPDAQGFGAGVGGTHNAVLSSTEYLSTVGGCRVAPQLLACM